MKKNSRFFAFAACLLLSTGAFAQSTPVKNGKGTATLNVKLYPMISLEVGGNNVVDLVYKSEADYKNGVSVTKNNHLTVNSTGGFVVKAKAESNLERQAGGAISAGTITLQLTGGAEKTLSTRKVDLITQTSSARNKKYDVTYKGAGNFNYVDKYVNGENPTIYTTQITYTAEVI